MTLPDTPKKNSRVTGAMFSYTRVVVVRFSGGVELLTELTSSVDVVDILYTSVKLFMAMRNSPELCSKTNDWLQN